ncbi:4606_t:CDS:2, partial [Diversispora eburnea]
IVELEQSAKESAENTKLRDVEINELRFRQKDSSDITNNTSNSDIYQEKDSRCPESPIHTEPKSPEDKMLDDFLDSVHKEKDLSCGNTETIPSKNDQAGNLCDMKTVPSGNDRYVNLSCCTKTISSENNQTEISDVECDKNEIVEQDNANSTENKGSAQHLSYLFKTAIKSRQQEILDWYYYSLEFENKVSTTPTPSIPLFHTSNSLPETETKVGISTDLEKFPETEISKKDESSPKEEPEAGSRQ